MKGHVLRALEEAEKMMMEDDDYGNAREQLIKVEQLYPQTEKDQIQSMLTACEILSAAKFNLPGCGLDYYWLLQAMPSSTLSYITARYHRIQALLQPLKPHFLAPQSALQLADEAFSVLSDNLKRSKYDSQRNASRETSEGYSMISLNLQALPRCQTKDMAETNFLENPISFQEVIDQKPSYQDYYNFENERKAQHIEAGQIWAFAHFRTALHHSFRYALVSLSSREAVCVTWLKPIPVSASEWRWCDAGLPVACGSFNLTPELTSEISCSTISSYSDKCSWVSGVVDDQFEIYPQKGEIWAVYKNWDIDEWAYSSDYLKQCKFELVEIISDFSKYTGAKCAYLVKVDGFKYIFERKIVGGNPATLHICPGMFYMFSHKVPAYRFMGGEIDKVVKGMVELDQLALPDCMVGDINPQKSLGTKHLSIFPCVSPICTSSHKPHPEDYFLKSHWSANDFAIGQIWAVYCGKDFMPQQYTRIENVISESQVYVTFLEPLTLLDTNLPIVCGVFKVGTTSVNIGISEFSHLVKCQQSTEALYKIQPLKGEIWAMYENWNNKWKQNDHEAYQCQVVQILSDFSGGDQIRIARLEKVKGYLTLFQKHQYEGLDLPCVASKEEELRFSHRIPAFRLPEIRRLGIPESAWHLEPNALPPYRLDKF